MENPFMCTYYDGADDKNSDYYDSTGVYDSVADAMIEAVTTISNRSEHDNRDIEVRVFEFGDDPE